MDIEQITEKIFQDFKEELQDLPDECDIVLEPLIRILGNIVREHE